MSGELKTWKEQMEAELEEYKKKEAVNIEKLIRLNQIERLLEEGKAMWNFLFEDTQEADFELHFQVKKLQEEYRSIKMETDKYNQYFLENSLEKDYYEGLRKQDAAALAAVQKEGFHKADYALAYILLCVKNSRKGADYLIEPAKAGDAYAMLRLGEFYEYRAVNEIGSRACGECIKEGIKWYTSAAAADSAMQAVCQEGKERISRVESVHQNNMKKRKSSGFFLKLFKTLNVIVPVAACLLLVLWIGLQALGYIRIDGRYAVDGRIYSEKESVPDKIFGMQTISVDKTAKEIIVPEGIKVVPRDLYRDCDLAEKAVIPEGVVKIEEGAFSGCSGLLKISFPSTLCYVEKEAFSNCTSLKSLNAKDTSLVKINSRAFYGCTKLKKVIIPPACIPAGDAFSGCSDKLKLEYAN